jgi:hypothetical protein
MVQQTKIKYFRVLLYTRSQAESRYNFGNGQGLAKGKEKGKGNTRIWRVEKRKNSTQKFGALHLYMYLNLAFLYIPRLSCIKGRESMSMQYPCFIPSLTSQKFHSCIYAILLQLGEVILLSKSLKLNLVTRIRYLCFKGGGSLSLFEILKGDCLKCFQHAFISA